MFVKRVHMKGEFQLVILPLEKDQHVGAMAVAKVLSDKLGELPSFDFTTEHGDEVSLPYPEGSLAAYIRKHQKLFSGTKTHVLVQAVYQPAKDEKLQSFPGTLKGAQELSGKELEDGLAIYKQTQEAIAKQSK